MVYIVGDLKHYFEKLGALVQDAIVLRNVNTNASRGFGFITFDSEEMADKLVRVNNYTIKGKKIDIKKAEPKQNKDRPSRYPY
jgi:RNA-binding protein Musashi